MDVHHLRAMIAWYGRICSNLQDASYILSTSNSDTLRKDKAILDSLIYKYEGTLESMKFELNNIQKNCEHDWLFSSYGSSDRIMKCSKCSLVRPEAKT